jgi:hypothetical protein
MCIFPLAIQAFLMVDYVLAQNYYYTLNTSLAFELSHCMKTRSILISPSKFEDQCILPVPPLGGKLVDTNN